MRNHQPSTINSYNYQLDAANQRVRSTLADGSYWLYEYDSLGQVHSGRRYWSDQTPVAGQQFEYTHDDIGNRTQTKAGGDQTGANLRTANYGANSLNEYTSRDVPAAFDVMGLGFATNAVTVNGQAAYRKGEYFRAEVPVSNGSTSVWQSVSVAATNQTTVSGNVYVAKNQEQFYYDLDGNLTNDGRWTYTWDAENRLAKMAPNTSIGPRNSLEFEYDWQGRRIHKQVWGNTNWTSTPTNDVKFVYDGWNLLAELNTTNHAVIRSFVWGLDLSGTIQGAGGVGGLLEVTYKGAQTTNCFVAFDGNGNVAGLADAGSTNVLVQCEYGPFGELLRATGPMVKNNSFRFSTKYQDDETDLLYYGYRYLNTTLGKWVSRDPAWEAGGKNIYAMVGNNPVGAIDVLGLWAAAQHRSLTEGAVSASYAALRTTRKCQNRIFGAIWEADEAQDDPGLGGSLWDNRRHYNRDVGQSGAEGENGYHTYLREETMRFVAGTIEHSTPTCRRALWSLGRLMHSWQDFFMHAIRRDGQGGKENTDFPGWTAWSAGVTGNPDANQSFYPSSFSIRGGGEHPVGSEPVLPSSPEFAARYNAAMTYTTPKVARLLQVWMRACRCPCEQASDLSWYTTELPGR